MHKNFKLRKSAWHNRSDGTSGRKRHLHARTVTKWSQVGISNVRYAAGIKLLRNKSGPQTKVELAGQSVIDSWLEKQQTLSATTLITTLAYTVDLVKGCKERECYLRQTVAHAAAPV